MHRWMGAMTSVGVGSYCCFLSAAESRTLAFVRMQYGQPTLASAGLLVFARGLYLVQPASSCVE